MSGLKRFIPDLIVEVTAVCNRSCSGCYAPNVVSTKHPKQLYEENPGLFLALESLTDRLVQLESFFGSQVSEGRKIAVRGGEPTLHPDLADVLEKVSLGGNLVFLETHGRWLLQTQTIYQDLLDKIQEQVKRGRRIQLKISFDPMHGTSVGQLEEMLAKAEAKEIPWSVAITESQDKIETVRALLGSVPDENIYFQPKAVLATDLVQPKGGVIHSNGTWSMGLTTRAFMKDLNQKGVGR